MRQNKELFIQELKQSGVIYQLTDSYQLKAAGLPVLQKHYREKLGIELIINGDSEYGRKCIQENRVAYQSQNGISDTTPYADYLLAHWMEEDVVMENSFFISKMARSSFQFDYDDLKEVLQTVLDDRRFLVNWEQNRQSRINIGRPAWFDRAIWMLYTFFLWIPFLFLFNSKSLLPDLLSSLVWNQIDHTTKERLNNALKELFVKKNGLKDLFDEKIEEYKSHIKTEIANISLYRWQVEQEIKIVQKQLKQSNDSRAVGYLFTNECAVKAVHMEALIIDQKRVIKPLNWNVEDHDALNFSFLYKQPDVFIQSDFIEPLPCAQSGATECGTLAILYLKELLKDNAKQLKEYSVVFEYNGNHFFFPSPQVLRYSQSSTYNKCLKALLADTDEVTMKRATDILHITPLKKVLSDELEFVKKGYGSERAAQLQEFLQKLPEFKDKWLKELEVSEQKRSTMHHGFFNTYLAYRAKKFETLINMSNSRY